MVALSKKPVNVPLLELPTDCVIGRFCRRLKRFSVEIELNGQKIWAHCNNTGSMLGLLRPGIKALISPAKNPRRKLAWTLEMLQLPGGKSGSFWAGVNTLLPNRMLKAAFHAGLLDFARDYSTMRPEAACGESRLDALFMGDGKPHLWVECKNVSMVEDEVAAFPDAQSERARKHLRGLMDIVAGGGRAAMFYLIQRPDAKCFGPADFIDPEYAELFYRAMEAGVEVYAHRAILCPHGASLGPRLPLAWLNITGKISIREN